jgi:DNA ligase (NAD+)
MDRESAREEIDGLVERINRLDHEYYVLNRPSVSDREYDRLFERLRELEEAHPDLRRPDSPTQRVGSDLSHELPEVEHSVPVLSLDKAYSAQEVHTWIERTGKRAGRPLTFVIEEKIDGVSIVLYYEGGVLQRAVTRGNGYVGNDITANVKTIGAVPLRLSEEVDAAVRGEIFLPLDRFDELNRSMESPYANPRNLAAGTLRRIKSRQVAGLPLDIFCYEGFFPESRMSHTEVLRYLRELGFRVSSRIGVFSSLRSEEELRSRYPEEWSFGPLEEIDAYIDRATAERRDLNYEIDGLVVKVNELAVRDELGYTGHHPRWAIAYKFESPEGSTTIETIDVQVGRTGRITPVARVEPVAIGGSTISNVTLHNQDYVELLEVSVGDTVSVSRRGDVIPAVERVVQKNEEGNPIWKMPDHCPSCGSRLELYGAHHFCRNQDCPAQVRGRIHFFIGSGQMDIENLGPETVELLIGEGHIKDVPDLYRIDFDILLDYQGYGPKKVQLIRDGVEKSKQQPFETVLRSLGIPEVGPHVTELLVGAGYTDVEQIIAAAREERKDDLTAIKGIGEKTARTIVEEFSRQEIRDRIAALRRVGLNFSARPRERAAEAEQLFAGQTWCVTGSFEQFQPRSKAMEEVKKRGGRATGQVTGNTTHLLAGEGGGSKLKKAQELGVEIVDEAQFLELLEQAGEQREGEGS